MPLSEVIKEAYALCPKNQVILETLEIQWRDQRIFLVSNSEDITAKLETGEEVTFQAAGVLMELPAKDDKGFSELNITISNTNLQASDFLQQTLDTEDPISCLYRPYLHSDLTTPQMNPPLDLTLAYAEVNIDTVSTKASFADMLNRSFLTENYTKTTNPAL